MKIKMTNGAFLDGTHYSKGKTYEVSEEAYKALAGSARPVGKAYTYTQNGTWYTVYLNGEQVDKFQGKDKLSDYGLQDTE